jgi:hypothetical protein
MVRRIKRSTGAALEMSTSKQSPSLQATYTMNGNGKRSDDKLSFLKNKKIALLNKFLTSKFNTWYETKHLVILSQRLTYRKVILHLFLLTNSRNLSHD